MNRLPHFHLSRRESQIMDIIFHLGEASVSQVVERMPDAPGYNTVRNTMAILERKGHLKHRQEGRRYLYTPARAVEQVKHSAVSHLVETFFDGSLPDAVLAMLGDADRHLTREDLDDIAAYVERARKQAG